ncbi:MAG: hypothetical protein KAK00_07355 [Nanoarchaeota archaeon]|nr:hypothetical protein [Nanoarchaeota archaeon]
MKLLNSKKADAFRMLNYAFWRLFFIAVVFLTIFLLVSSQIKTKIKTDELKAAIFIQRLLNSDKGISYVSEYNFRNYPGIISLDRFNNKTISTQFNIDSDRFSANIFLEDLETETQNELYLNKNWFERYYPLSKFDKYEGNLKWRYVLVKGDQLHKGRMLIKTVESKNE